MPILSRRTTLAGEGARAFPRVLHVPTSARAEQPVRSRDGWLETCANPDCRSGWFHLWRSHTAPVFENGWTCSPECTHARIAAAVARELDGLGSAREVHRHRVPLGLLMLEKGWITQTQLRRALEAQKEAGSGRLGQWLISQHAIREEHVTRALGLQWSCPVLSLERYDPAVMTAVMPRLFVDAFGALPLRIVGGRLLYLGFEAALDPVLALALERISGLRVESGIVAGTAFHRAQQNILALSFPGVELIEAISGSAAALALARSFERARPGAGRLVRVHDCLWLRMWEKAGTGFAPGSGWIRDVICSVGSEWR